MNAQVKAELPGAIAPEGKSTAVNTTLMTPTGLAHLLPSPAALDRLVYLVGPARGGTSVIHAAMDANPAALVLPGVTHFLQQVWRYRNVVHDRLLRQIIQLGQAWDQEAIQARLDPAQNAEFRRIVNAAFAAKDMRSLYHLLPIAYALSPAFAKPPSQITCWHDKSNDWRHLGVLSRAFPQARFIFVVRDPRSVVLSGALRESLKAGEVVPRLEHASVVDMALYWRLMVQRCLSFAQHQPDRSRIVRFEDFLEAPVAVLRDLFHFTVGRAPDDDAIARAISGIAGSTSNDPAARYRGVSREPLARWKSAMSADQVALVAQLTAPTARKLGYDIARAGGLIRSFRALGRGGGSRARLRGAAKIAIEEAWEPFLRRAG